MSPTRLVLSVLLPFAAGYFMSYVFRTINAVIFADLAAELDLGAADLGLLTATYFLIFAAVQLPLGALLDRVEPRLMQSTLLLFAAAGALVFAVADGFATLLIGRALIGLGVAMALMTGVKAITSSFPSERLASAMGSMMMLGGLGALAAAGPAELIAQQIGWRGLFVVLAALSALTALLILVAVPASPPRPAAQRAKVSVLLIYRDPRFWRVAPLCALGVGTSWSLQSLWAAPWLRDVEGLKRTFVVHHLSAMAIAVSAGALLLGMMADRLRRLGFKIEALLFATFMLSALAQAALVLRLPVPSLLPWTIVAAAGAGTVLSYTLMSEYFPKHMSGRANGALNLLHLGAAFLLQWATGLIIAQWPNADGAYPPEAHQMGLAIPLAMQLGALAWLAMPRRRPMPSMLHTTVAFAGSAGGSHRSSSYPAPTSLGALRDDVAARYMKEWRLAALASASLCVALSLALLSAWGQSGVRIRVVEAAPWS